MKESEINILNRSFGILDKRRADLLKDERTIQLKERVKKIREDSTARLHQLLEIAIERLLDNGIEVIIAHDSLEAVDAIYGLVKDQELIAKSKSNTAGEIRLTEYLEKRDVKILETDLGDRIIQFDPLSNPSHPIGPASHLDLARIAEIVSEQFGLEVPVEPRAILDVIKGDIMEKLSECHVSITGANSIAAEDGSLLMVHNEGNISLLTMMDLHIILVGIDKLVPTLEEAISVVKLETIYATGKTVPAYMNVISSPSKTADIEQVLLKDMYGAKRVIAVLLDNGRIQALDGGMECLWCIGCGSCIVNCPIYNVLGPDFGYLSHLGGRGVVLSRFLEDQGTCFDSGLFKCTLCGLCTLECPVEIPTNEMIEMLRSESIEKGFFLEKHDKIKNNIKKRKSPFSSKEI
jgi:L-lactate utilization protein LutB